MCQFEILGNINDVKCTQLNKIYYLEQRCSWNRCFFFVKGKANWFQSNTIKSMLFHFPRKLNETNVNSSLASKQRSVFRNSTVSEKEGSMNARCPIYLTGPDINSSERCVVSHSHRTRHDIMLQTYLKTPHLCGRCVVSGFQIGGSTFKRFWIWQRVNTHTCTNTHAQTHRHTHVGGWGSRLL